MKLEVITFKKKDIRIDCTTHGVVEVQTAYDHILDKMTGISCAKCPTITKDMYLFLKTVLQTKKNKIDTNFARELSLLGIDTSVAAKVLVAFDKVWEK